MGANAYYEDELSYLRELGAEFARANPKLASFLGREASDPDVERLLEGFAFLTGRLRQRLDDELPELSHALIRLVWPHYLRPIPPLTILQFESPAAAAGPTPIAAGARVRSRPVGGVSCEFRTAYAMTLVPFELGGIETELRPTSARLLFRLKAAGKNTAGALPNGTLRLFLNSEREPHIAQTLLLWLARHVRGIECAGDNGARLALGPSAVRPGGFDESEAVLPWPANSFDGFRLLQEYLTYPTKFLFVDIAGLSPAALGDARTLSFTIDFDRPLPAQFRLTDGQLRLNCVPALNLFDHDADPIRADRAKSEYRVLPLGGGATSIHSIEAVTGYQQGRSDRRVYEPFETFRHDLPGGRSEKLYFRERLRPSVTGRGVESYLSFVDRLATTAVGEAEVISIKLRCTSGALAERLAVGSVNQPTPDLPGGIAVSNITSVSPEIAPPIGDNLMWRLVANLARNYASFASIEGLRSVVAAYDFRAVRDVQARRRLELLLQSLDSMEISTRDTVLRGIPARLRLMTLAVDESKIGGEAEFFLFGAVLNAYFSGYVGINALHQFAIRGLESKARFEWPPRVGTGRAA